MPKKEKLLDNLFHDTLKDVYFAGENSCQPAKNAKGGSI
jgi:hypothetical protein